MKKIVALVLSLVMVLGLATVAFGATAQVMYSEVDATTGEWSTPVAVAAKLSDIAVDADETNLAHYVFTIGADSAKYYVKDAANTATIKVVYGNTTVYLAEVDGYDVAADAEAAVFTDISEKAACGKLTVGKAGLKDTYYVTYDVDGEIDTFYKKVKAYSGVSLMVDGAIVYAEEITGAALVEHNWVGNDIDKNGNYVSVVCDRCDKVATLFANKTAAGKGAEYVDGFGWITATAAELSTPVAGDKVESAETFDAGIAMYVGMSVMAAAGSAVVLKKKD